MSGKIDKIVGHCVQRILAQPKRPLFVAITGDSGSGKSYLASLIAKGIKSGGTSCVVINHDEFLISRSDREPMKHIFYAEGEFAGKSQWEVLENMFRLDEFERVIKTLKDNQCAEYRPYSRKSGDVEAHLVKRCPAKIILFDTSMMLNEMDFIILIDVTQQNIIKRKIQRDRDIRTPEQIREMHEKVQGYYWERGRPKRADIVIDNNDLENMHLVQA